MHCKAGRGRSTTVVLCYLVKYKGMTPGEALAMVRGKRPQIHLAQVLVLSCSQNLALRHETIRTHSSQFVHHTAALVFIDRARSTS